MRQPALNISVTCTPRTSVGGEIEYQVTVSNISDTACSNTVVETKVQTQTEQVCSQVVETKCNKVLVTKTRQVPDRECVPVTENQCGVVWKAEFDKQCATTFEKRYYKVKVTHSNNICYRYNFKYIL